MNAPASHLKAIHRDDGTAILDVVQGTLTTLNPIGGFIWRSLSQGMSEKEVTEHLGSEYPEHRQQIAEDVRAFKVALEENHLLSSQVS